MRYHELGSSGIRVSKMGLGTWAIGGGPAWGGDLNEQVCIDTIKEAINDGINMIDTAPGYNFGNSERIVGKALREVDRDKVVLVTKCGVIWSGEGGVYEGKGTPWNMVGDRRLYKLLTPESIRREVEMSLKRLGTDYIDLYMTHWPSVPPFETPIAETVGELNRLKKEGKIRAIGAANVNIEQIEEYVANGELDLVQGKYNVLSRDIEKDLLPICKKHKITMQAYSPLEQGLLTGVVPREFVPGPGDARANKPLWQPDVRPKVHDMLDHFKPIADKYNCSIAALNLAWIMCQGDTVNLLTGATTPDQVKMNVVAADVVLEPEDIKKMNDLAAAVFM